MSQTVKASTFKAKCLAMLDEVASSGVELVVTKRGKAVAKVLPIELPASLRSSVSYKNESDLLSPTEGTWEAER